MKNNKIEDFYSGKRVLITGGLGMIGSNLAIELVKLNANVTILNNMSGNIFNIEEIKSKVKVVYGDVTDNAVIVKSVKDKDMIFHLAARVSKFPVDINEVLEELRVNRLSNLLMLESIKRYNDDATIIFSGSRLEYGKARKLPVKEEHSLEPISFYGIDKLAAEKYYSVYCDTYGIKSICFRVTNPYGPRSQMKSSSFNIVNWFIRKALDNEKIQIYGNGNQLRDYIYVQDLVEGLIIASSNKRAIGGVFNIGSGKAVKFREMAEMIVKIAGQGSIEYFEWPENYKLLETGDFVADIRKIMKLGWRPKTKLAEGIKKAIDYYSKYKAQYW